MSLNFFTSVVSQMYQVLDYASCFSALLGMMQTDFAFLQKSKMCEVLHCDSCLLSLCAALSSHSSTKYFA